VEYNIIQSEIAIGRVALPVRLLKGTQTQGGFVPEQHTDFIFSAIGEESGLLVREPWFLFMPFSRLVIMAERQKTNFARI
jgi:rod shape determining protein RodA